MSLETIFKQHQEDLEKLNNQRKIWLWASSCVIVGIVLLIFGWDWLSDTNSKSIWWVIISLMLVISVNWWYWTMKVIRVIISYQEIEYQLIKEIYEEINSIKADAKKSFELVIGGLKESSR